MNYFPLLFLTSCVSALSETAQDAASEARLFDDLFRARNYTKTSRPVVNTTDPVVVKLGLTYSHLVNLDEKNQILMSNVFVRQRWVNPSLVWDPAKYNGINGINVDPDWIWVPDVVLYNNADTRSDGAMDRSKYKVQLFSNGVNLWLSPYILLSRCYVKVSFFPFDYQVCKLIFGSWTYAADKLDLQPNDNEGASVNMYSENSEWDLLGIPMKTNIKTYPCCPEPYVDLTYSIQIHRRPLFYLFNFIIPSYLILVMVLFSFNLPPESSERISLVSTTLLSMVVFLLNVNDSLPATSDSSPILSDMYTMCMFTLVFALVSTCVILRLYYTNPKRKKMPKWFRKIVLVYMAKIFRARKPMLFHPAHTHHEYMQQAMDFLDDSSHNVMSSVSHDVNSENRENQCEFSNENDCIENTENTDVIQNGNNVLPDVTHHEHRINYIAIRQEEENLLDEVRLEWLYAAIIFDKACWWLFLVTVVFSTIGIVLRAPSSFSDDPLMP